MTISRHTTNIIYIHITLSSLSPQTTIYFKIQSMFKLSFKLLQSLLPNFQVKLIFLEAISYLYKIPHSFYAITHVSGGTSTAILETQTEKLCTQL